MKEKKIINKEISKKTVIIWFLAIMLIIQAALFLSLKIRIRNDFLASESEREKLSGQVQELVMKEIEEERQNYR